MSFLHVGERLGAVVDNILVEVKWDVTFKTVEGRRRGEEVTKPFWWKARVAEVQRGPECVNAMICYESGHGFESQIHRAIFFPSHLQHPDIDDVQLRWKFFELCGEQDERLYDREDSGNAEGDSMMSRNLLLLKGKTESAISRIDVVEKTLQSQAAFLACRVPVCDDEDRILRHMFGFLRKRLAIALQKPLPPSRMKRDVQENGGSLFNVEETACSGFIRAIADCTLSEFETVSRYVHMNNEESKFSPVYPLTQSPSVDMKEASILFPDIKALCNVIGIRSTSDILRIIRKPKARSSSSVDEESLRVLGSFLFCQGSSDRPTAFFVGKSLVPTQLGSSFHSLYRSSGRYDLVNKDYLDSLQVKIISPSAAMSEVYGWESSNVEQLEICRKKLAQIGGFSLCWRASPQPSDRIWSRAMIEPTEVNGHLEVRLPYLLCRGDSFVTEIRDLLQDSYLLKFAL